MNNVVGCLLFDQKKESKMDPLDKFIKEFLENQEVAEEQKTGLRALLDSSLTEGKRLEKLGKFRDALIEYSKEHDRFIRTSADAEIAQKSYFFTGSIYWKLQEVNNAIVNFQKALEMFRFYKIGMPPHEHLADIFIQLGRYDEAIALCEEYLKETTAWSVKRLLEKAIELRDKK